MVVQNPFHLLKFPCTNIALTAFNPVLFINISKVNAKITRLGHYKVLYKRRFYLIPESCDIIIVRERGFFFKLSVVNVPNFFILFASYKINNNTTQFLLKLFIKWVGDLE